MICFCTLEGATSLPRKQYTNVTAAEDTTFSIDYFAIEISSEITKSCQRSFYAVSRVYPDQFVTRPWYRVVKFCRNGELHLIKISKKEKSAPRKNALFFFCFFVYSDCASWWTKIAWRRRILLLLAVLRLTQYIQSDQTSYSKALLRKIYFNGQNVEIIASTVIRKALHVNRNEIHVLTLFFKTQWYTVFITAQCASAGETSIIALASETL